MGESMVNPYTVRSQDIVPANLRPTYLQFGNIRIHCETGEVTGLSENISEDAQQFWNHIKENIIGIS